MLPLNLITAARCSPCELEEDLFSCDALYLQLGQLLLTMDGAVVLISRTSPLPTMRLPAKKEIRVMKNVWIQDGG